MVRYTESSKYLEIYLFIYFLDYFESLFSFMWILRKKFKNLIIPHERFPHGTFPTIHMDAKVVNTFVNMQI